MGFQPTSRDHPSGGRLGVSSENSGFSSHSVPPGMPPVGGGPDRPTAGGRRPRVGWSGALLGGAVVRQGLGHPALDLLDAGLLGRVRRQPLRRPLALAGLGHPPPPPTPPAGALPALA